MQHFYRKLTMAILNIFLSVLLNISILTEAGPIQQANISVQLKDLSTGEVIEAYRPNNVVPPASVMKLLTTRQVKLLKHTVLIMWFLRRR